MFKWRSSIKKAGSMAMHGSHTRSGAWLDNVSMVAYILIPWLFNLARLGRWSDRSGRRPVLVVSQAGTLAAWLLFLLALRLPPTTFGTLAGATLTTHAQSTTWEGDESADWATAILYRFQNSSMKLKMMPVAVWTAPASGR